MADSTTNRQFSFSFTVGIALAIFGGILLPIATVGLSLIALGLAISVLVLLTRSVSQNTAQPVALRTGAQHSQESAANY